MLECQETIPVGRVVSSLTWHHAGKSRDHSCGKGRGLSIRLRLVSPSACSLVWHRVGMSRLGCGPLYQVAFGVSKCTFSSLVSCWDVQKAFPWGGMQLLDQSVSDVSCMFSSLALCLDVNHLGKRWKSVGKRSVGKDARSLPGWSGVCWTWCSLAIIVLEGQECVPLARLSRGLCFLHDIACNSAGISGDRSTGSQLLKG